MSGHRKFWASLWCHISTVSLVFKFSRAFLEIFRSVFTPTTSVFEILASLWCHISKKHWEWILGARGPHHRTTHLQNVLALDLAGDWVSPHGRIKEVVHQGPESSHQPSAGAGRSAASSPGCSVSDLWLSVRGHFSVTLLSHICFRLFLLQYGSDWQLATLVSIFGTCVTFSSVSEFSVYSMEEEAFCSEN